MIEQKQSTLLKLAGCFLILFAIILSLSPAVRERTWDVTYRWRHWAGLLAWIGSLLSLTERPNAIFLNATPTYCPSPPC